MGVFVHRKHTTLNAKSLYFALLILFALNFPPLSVHAEDELPFGNILLGMSTALTGPASDLGRNMLLGVKARLAKENGNGGIKGRLLHLIVRDDGYEPDRAARNIRYLIEIKNGLNKKSQVMKSILASLILFFTNSIFQELSFIESIF